MRLGGALMTGLVFGFSLWAVTWVSWPHDERLGVPALAVPAVRAARCDDPGRCRSRGWRGVVGLQFLGGHPASSYQVLLVVVLFWVGARARVAGAAARAPRRGC